MLKTKALVSIKDGKGNKQNAMHHYYAPLFLRKHNNEKGCRKGLSLFLPKKYECSANHWQGGPGNSLERAFAKRNPFLLNFIFPVTQKERVPLSFFKSQTPMWPTSFSGLFPSEGRTALLSGLCCSPPYVFPRGGGRGSVDQACFFLVSCQFTLARRQAAARFHRFANPQGGGEGDGRGPLGAPFY